MKRTLAKAPVAAPTRTLALLATLVLTGSTLASAPALAKPTSPQIHVQASATLEKTPDMATLDARLWERTPARVQGEEPSGDSDAIAEARSRLEQRTSDLIRTLEDAGIDSEAIRAGSLSVRPDYLLTNGRDSEPPKVRTQVERPVSLTLDSLDRLPQVLDALTAAGVDALDGVSYGLKQSEAADDEALTQALARARDKAELMARTLGVELGDVISIEETTAPGYQPMMMRAANMDESTAPAYRSGDISIEASVDVTWEIED